MTALAHHALLMAASGSGASASLLHCDGSNGSTTFTDEYGRTWTRNGTSTTISTAQSKFGGSSLSIGSGGQTGVGTNNGITTPNTPDILIGDSEYTIEWQQYWRSFTAFQTVFSKGGTLANAILLQTGNGDGKYIFYISGTGVMTESSAPTTGSWIQYQLKRSISGGTDTWTLTRAGVVTATTSRAHNTLSSTEAPCWGAYIDGTYATDSYLDELRITKGVARAYATQTAPWTD